MKHQHLAAAAITAVLATCAAGAAAQSMKPGLWEITNKISGSAEMDRALATMQQQMASMPPEQRKTLQDMMAKQGVSMGSGPSGSVTAKVCMTKEMAERNEMPQPHQGGCKTTLSPPIGNTRKVSYTCTQPPSSGEGEITYMGSDAYTVKVVSTTAVRGQAEKTTINGTGKYLSADCGALKPVAMPGK